MSGPDSDLRRYLAGEWSSREPGAYYRTLAPGYAIEVRDTAVGWLAHLRREGVPLFFLRPVTGVADVEALVAVLGG